MGGAFGAGKAVHDNWANRKTLGLGGMIKTAFAGFASGTITGMAAGATFSAGNFALKATGSVLKASLAGFGAGFVSGFAGGAAGSAAGQAITGGKISGQAVLQSAYSTAAGLSVAGMAAPALGVGNKAVTKVIGKALGKAGMKETLAAGTATVACMAGEGTLLGGMMAGAGDIAAQGYNIHAGNQAAINWKQTAKSTFTGAAGGFLMGGAFGMFSLTPAGQSFGKWMSEPTKLDMKAAEMMKSFWGDNRGSVSLGKTSYGKSSEKHSNTADFLTNIENRNGKFYTDKATIDKIGQNEVRGEDFSLLDKQIISSRPSTEGGTSIVYKYSDDFGTKYIIHEVTDGSGYIIHRDFDAVRISSGQLINKDH